MVRRGEMKCVVAALAAFALSGCYSHLHVKLSVMDQEKVQELVEKWQYQPLVMQARAGDTSLVDNEVDKICRAYADARIRTYTADVEAAKAALPTLTATVRRSSQVIISIQEDELVRLKSAPPTRDCIKDGDYGFIDVRELHKEFLAVGKPVNTRQEIRARNENVLKFRSRLDTARLDIKLELQGLEMKAVNEVENRLPNNAAGRAAERKVTEARAEGEAAKQQADDRIDASSVTGYLGSNGRTLAISELAHEAVLIFNEEEAAKGKPNPDGKRRVWAEEYNVASGTGFGGSTDMVMKLTNDADFSVKGVTFDARSTASAVRKVTMSSIQVLASGAGLPMKVPAPTEADPKKTEVIPTTEITAAKAKVAAAEAAEKNYRTSLRALAASVMAAGDDAAGAGGVSPTTARARAKATFDALRPGLAAPQAK